MKYNNHTIQYAYYNGHRLKKIYGCDNHQVFDDIRYSKMYFEKNDSTTGKVSCNHTTKLSSNETLNAVNNQPSAVTKVIIGDCITTIGQYAFSGFSSIEEIEIPSGITTIETMAFTDCDALKSIVIPDTVTLLYSDVFGACIGLTNATIGSGVTIIPNELFYGCSSLTSVTMSDNVTSIGYNAFRDCTSLESITIPSGVTSIDSLAINGCSGLTSVTVEATTPPTLGGNVFYNTNNCPIYVPAESVDTYKAASGWSNYSSRIQAIP